MKIALRGDLVEAGIAYLDREKLLRLLDILEGNPPNRVELAKEFLLREVGMEKLLEQHALLEAECRKAKGTS
jgi:hypothetical protein